MVSQSKAYEEMKFILGSASKAEVSDFLQRNYDHLDVRRMQGFVNAVMERATRVHIDSPSMDIVGTGGYSKETLNVSTISAIVLASTGLVKVTKHGNKAISSKFGSADLMQALGYKFPQTPERVVKLVDDSGFAFLLAPYFHPAFGRHEIKEARKDFTEKLKRDGKLPYTVFNLLGVLCNPSNPTYRLVGVSNEKMGEKIASLVHSLDTKNAMIVSSQGMDEFTLHCHSRVWHVNSGREKLSNSFYSANMFGLPSANIRDLSYGGSDRASIVREILSGKVNGSKRDFVLYNSGAAISVVTDKSIDNGISIAAECIDSGRAIRKLDEIILTSRA